MEYKKKQVWYHIITFVLLVGLYKFEAVSLDFIVIVLIAVSLLAWLEVKIAKRMLDEVYLELVTEKLIAAVSPMNDQTFIEKFEKIQEMEFDDKIKKEI